MQAATWGTDVVFDLTTAAATNALLISGLIEDADDAFLLSELTLQAVPVPASIWLLISGLAGLAGFRRNRYTNASSNSHQKALGKLQHVDK